MALDLPLPKKIFGHPWLLFANDKMSKSKGNIMYADDLVNFFGVDAIRYYVLHEIPFANDGTITYEPLAVKEIIREAVHQYGLEPYANIIINDVDNIAIKLKVYRISLLSCLTISFALTVFFLVLAIKNIIGIEQENMMDGIMYILCFVLNLAFLGLAPAE